MGSPTPSTVRLGITRLLEDPGRFLGRARVGFVGSYNLVDEQARPIIRLLHDHPEVRLTALFSAEHGLWEAAQAGVPIPSSVDRYTGLPVFSLYGPDSRPTPEVLREVDLLLYDSADIGCRFYTSISTMCACMEAAAAAGKPIVVADRPNPLGGVAVEGNVVKPGFRSFVGCQPIAVRHGMTAGELANMFNRDFGVGADLTVVPLQGWRRDMVYPDTGLVWTASPNMPGFETALTYAGTCLVEGTTCSEGRGTARPFRLVGAPWVDPVGLAEALAAADLPGVKFRPARFVPWFSKHCGLECGGVEVHITDPRLVQPFRVGLELLCQLRSHDPAAFGWVGTEAQPGPGETRPLADGACRSPRLFIDSLGGGPELREWVQGSIEPEEMLERWKPELEAFRAARARFLLY